ncbi:TPA: hypothetical protein ACH3X2_011897 [Trebouxia sp. C0005]
MSAFRNRSTGEHELVGRINSEHLSDQFQRELSATPEDELLQDRELRIDDIHSASGSGIAALANTQHVAQKLRPDMLASLDVSDDNWLVASPYTSPTSALAPGSNGFHSADAANGRALSPETNGNAANVSGRQMERSPSKALTDAYAQPSKIPKFNQASTSTGSLHRQASRGSAVPTRTQPVTRAKSGALRNSKLAAPSPTKLKGVKPPILSPPQSISDSGEDGQPVWRAVTKPPAPKYTQQTDIALGGPFERSSSQQLPRANSTQRANSDKPRFRSTSRPTSASRASTKPQAPAAQGDIQLTQESTILPSQSRPSAHEPSPDGSGFQSRIPAAPRAASPDVAAEPTSSGRPDAKFASAVAQAGDLNQAGQPAILSGATTQQQPAAKEPQAHQHANAQQQQQLHVKGVEQDGIEADAARDQEQQVHTGPTAELHVQEPVSPDQVDIGLKQSGGPSDILADAQHAQTPEAESKQKKMAKCCCCVIM